MQEARRKEKHRLRMREQGIENPESVVAARERQKERQAANCLERKLTGHHKLRSSQLGNALTKKTVLSCVRSIERQFGSFEGSADE